MTVSFRKSIAHALVVSTCFLSVITMHVTMAASYITPNQTKELFKLEKIPLQVDSMKELSKHLIVVSRRQQDDSGPQLRATAQMLTLAILLNPANQSAREMDRSFSDGKRPKSPPEAAILKAKARLIFYHRWLASTAAGDDANLLANLLADATKTLQPDTLNNPDIANWTGVVAPLKNYTTSEISPKDDYTADHIAKNDQENASPKTAITPIAPPISSKFHITKLSLRAPFELINYQKYKNPRSELTNTRTITTHAVSTIDLVLTPGQPDEDNYFEVKSVHKGKNHEQKSLIFKKTQDTLLSLLTNRHGRLPHFNSDVLISGGFYGKGNELALTAPLALMLESSLNNTPLRKDLHLCATLDSTGKLSLPKNFWQIVGALRENPTGGRLIIPTAAYEMLTQILVYGDPDFFTQWEILTADTLDGALAVATQKSSEDLSHAHDYFKTIQDLALKNGVTKLAANHAVRSRLEEILKLAPNHLSAKILLLQGSGKRPMRLSEKSLAHELIPVIKKMNDTLQHKLYAYMLSASTLKNMHEESRDSIDKLDRLVDRSHDDLYQDALLQANECRRLATMVRRSDGYQNSKSMKLFYSIQRDTKALLQKTLIAAGFPAPVIKKVDKKVSP